MLEFQVPGWSLILAGLCLFAYQSLDAIDGKQARRTGSATPLGELFDHGCDALSVGEAMVVNKMEFITAWCTGLTFIQI